MIKYSCVHERNSLNVLTSLAPALIRIALLSFALTGGHAFAAGDELGDGVCEFVNMLSGKWLFGLSVLAIFASGAALLFGAELSDGLKKIITIILIVGLILAASPLLAKIYTQFNGMTC